MATTRTMSKKVKRFLLVGRVVRKKLTRATQEMLEAVKESRQRSNCTAAGIPGVIWSSPSFWSSLNELVFKSILIFLTPLLSTPL